MRSKYMLSEYENVKNGKSVQYPSQFGGAVGKLNTIPFIPITILILSIDSDEAKDPVIKQHSVYSKMSAAAP